MPIRAEENVIFLESQCSIEEAEELHEVLKQIESPVFDLSRMVYLHTAIIQLIVFSAGAVRGLRDDPVLQRIFARQLAA